MPPPTLPQAKAAAPAAATLVAAAPATAAPTSPWFLAPAKAPPVGPLPAAQPVVATPFKSPPPRGSSERLKMEEEAAAAAEAAWKEEKDLAELCADLERMKQARAQADASEPDSCSAASWPRTEAAPKAQWWQSGGWGRQTSSLNKWVEH